MGIRVLLADDHRIVRDGLCALLSREPDIEVVGHTGDGLEAVRLVRTLRPDVVVTDVSMPGLNGIDVVRRIRAEENAARVLCLSVHSDSRMVVSVLEAGASGYVLKDASFDELALAIRKAVAGQIHLSAELVGLVVNKVRTGAGQPAHARDNRPPLTPREREVVQLLAEGLSTQQVADRLHVSSKTVATHRENVLQKLQIRGIAELTRYALREGLSSLDVACRAAGPGKASVTRPLVV